MTTDKEALQKIFEAALKEPESTQPPRAGRRPQHATPEGMGRKIDTAFATPPPRRPIKRACEEVMMPNVINKPKGRFSKAAARDHTLHAATAVATAPEAPVLDDKASDELGALLQEKMDRENRARKRQRLVTVLVAVALVGGGSGWFIQNPERVAALTSAIKEVRSVTDIKKLVGSYEESLDKVSLRSQQIDQATMAMGGSTELKEGEDAYMEDEMKSMMGGEGKTTGARARAMQNTFGDRAKEAGGLITPKGEISEKDSFSY